jgi:hypothetical protein
VTGSYTPHLLTDKSSLDDWLADDTGRKALQQVLSEDQFEELKAADEHTKLWPLYRMHYIMERKVTESEIEKVCEKYQQIN